jgi:hypothetical protein
MWARAWLMTFDEGIPLAQLFSPYFRAPSAHVSASRLRPTRGMRSYRPSMAVPRTAPVAKRSTFSAAMSGLLQTGIVVNHHAQASSTILTHAATAR